MPENNISSENIKSYELVTEELVQEALANDKGKGSELLSWEVKSFTNKGDNYSSIVACIQVKYKNNETVLEDSYVVKLNPLRPQSPFTDLMEDMYCRETVVLSSVIGGMNKHLGKIGLPYIRTPKLFARHLEKGKEAFVTKNLRNEGFKMHDRRKGLDLNHANLVLEELGRFHASSLLFEETLAPKTIPESFDHFDESWFDLNHPSFKVFKTMMAAFADGAIKFLQTMPKYQICVKWLNTNQSNMAKFFIEGVKPNKKFNVFAHGDSWTNNILFKYNDDNIPVDMRFVDLQGSRKASPASDIVYFFYSSLNGDVRTKHFQRMLYNYYQSFSKVLIFSRRKVPFTFKELLDEVENRKIFGLVSGMMLIQGILFAEGDEIWDIGDYTHENTEEILKVQNEKFNKMSEREGPFKDRFLALFTEMMDSHVFDEN